MRGSQLESSRGSIESRRRDSAVSRSQRADGPVAVYDTVTEGMTGWRFLRTWRWFGYIAATAVFAIVCVALSSWQYGRGQQTSAENTIVAANFSASPIPLEVALPTRSSYDESQNWQRVSLSGVYLPDDELSIRNRPLAGANGFEVVTPIRLDDGSTFFIDRGWVAPSPDDALSPDLIPSAPSDRVDVVVRLRPSEAPRGTGTVSDGQIGSVNLPAMQQEIDAPTYSGAYGVLDSQSPAGASGLEPLQTSVPLKDVGTHYSYTLQWLLFGILGFVALGLGARREYRRLNVDEPDEKARASQRQRKRARKPFSEEELEDEAIDGYIPLSRWGSPQSTSPIARPALRPLAQRTGSIEPTSSSDEPTVYVIYTDPDADGEQP